MRLYRAYRQEMEARFSRAGPGRGPPDMAAIRHQAAVLRDQCDAAHALALERMEASRVLLEQSRSLMDSTRTRLDRAMADSAKRTARAA
jgi:hypothetical protein